VQEGRLERRVGAEPAAVPRGREAGCDPTAGNTGNECHREIRARVAGRAADLFDIDEAVIEDSANFHIDPKGDNIYFGVREFGMLRHSERHGRARRHIPYGSTFFLLFGLRQTGAPHGRA